MAKEKEKNEKMYDRKKLDRGEKDFDQEQMEKDLKKIKKFGAGCNCFGCAGYGEDEIQIKHPWFFGAYRERKERERIEKASRSRAQNIVELKKILAEFEARLDEEEKEKERKEKQG